MKGVDMTRWVRIIASILAQLGWLAAQATGVALVGTVFGWLGSKAIAEENKAVAAANARLNDEWSDSEDKLFKRLLAERQR
jgi:hypothetical protein